MPARVFDPLRLDVQTFATDGAQLQGEWPLQHFERVADMVMAPPDAPSSGPVRWSAQGEARTQGHRGGAVRTRLRLRAQTLLHLQCQRCLQAVDTPIAVDRWFCFVQGEDAAAQIDLDSEDDVLAVSRSMDLSELLEDELLLALPLVPRHDSCPSPLRAPSQAQEQGPELPGEQPAHPFAALAALKRKGSLN